MIALAWRQFRTNAFITACALVAAAIAIAVTAPTLRHIFDVTVAGCAARGDCGPAIDTLQGKFGFMQGLLSALLKAVPALIGIFWGAPLVAREIETGTYRLAWTQSVTRTRWLVSKLAVVGLASVAATGLLTIAVAQWASPLDRALANRFLYFDVRGVTPMAYAFAAFAIGVAAGVLMRRTLPAMATGLGMWFALRFAFTYWVRPRLLPARHTVQSLMDADRIGFIRSPQGISFTAGTPHLQNALVVSSKIVDAAGGEATPGALHSFMVQYCPQLVANAAAPGPPSIERKQASVDLFQNCVQQLSTRYHLALTYQPHSRFWPLQWSEAAIFGVLAFGLCALSVWWVRRRYR